MLVLTSGGNLLDSVSLAMCAALGETVLPKARCVGASGRGWEEGLARRAAVSERRVC